AFAASARRAATPRASTRGGRRRFRLPDLRHGLLELHRAIVAVEREDLERRNGAIGAAELLRVLIEDPAWAWLRPLSALIVQLDELAEDAGGKSGEAVLAETRKLLKPDSAGTPFQQHYAWL